MSGMKMEAVQTYGRNNNVIKVWSWVLIGDGFKIHVIELELFLV
jgi:hypothetical protein